MGPVSVGPCAQHGTGYWGFTPAGPPAGGGDGWPRAPATLAGAYRPLHPAESERPLGRE